MQQPGRIECLDVVLESDERRLEELPQRVLIQIQETDVHADEERDDDHCREQDQIRPHQPERSPAAGGGPGRPPRPDCRWQGRWRPCHLVERHLLARSSADCAVAVSGVQQCLDRGGVIAAVGQRGLGLGDHIGHTVLHIGPGAGERGRRGIALDLQERCQQRVLCRQLLHRICVGGQVAERLVVRQLLIGAGEQVDELQCQVLVLGVGRDGEVVAGHDGRRRFGARRPLGHAEGDRWQRGKGVVALQRGLVQRGNRLRRHHGLHCGLARGERRGGVAALPADAGRVGQVVLGEQVEVPGGGAERLIRAQARRLQVRADEVTTLLLGHRPDELPGVEPVRIIQGGPVHAGGRIGQLGGVGDELIPGRRRRRDAGGGEHVGVVSEPERSHGRGDADLIGLIGSGHAQRLRQEPLTATDLAPVVVRQGQEALGGVRDRGERRSQVVDVRSAAGHHGGLDLGGLVGGAGVGLDGQVGAGLGLEFVGDVLGPRGERVRKVRLGADVNIQGTAACQIPNCCHCCYFPRRTLPAP